MTSVKTMLSGMLLVIIGGFLAQADIGNAPFAYPVALVGIIVFVLGLFIPGDGQGKPVNDDCLPQKKCPGCGKTHDFDYPKCPHCGYTENRSPMD